MNQISQTFSLTIYGKITNWTKKLSKFLLTWIFYEKKLKIPEFPHQKKSKQTFEKYRRVFKVKY